MEENTKPKKKKSVGFSDNKNEIHEFELEEGKELKNKNYPTKKSVDADITLEKDSSPNLSPEEEFAQFKVNFQEKSSRIYMVNHMVKRNQENLREEAQGKEMLHDMVSNEEEAYQAASIKNVENVEASLKEDALEKMLNSSLDKEFSKLQNKNMAQEYYDEKKKNMQSHIKKMDKTLAPKIENIIEKAESKNSIDELYDSNEVQDKKKQKATQEVYNEFDKLISNNRKKVSVRFVEKDNIREYETEVDKLTHYPNPKNMNHEDKSSRVVMDTENVIHEPPKYSKDGSLDKDVELEKFMTNFIQNSSKEFLRSHVDKENKNSLSDSCNIVLDQEFRKISENNKESIKPYFDEMKKNMNHHLNNMNKNLLPKIEKMSEKVKENNPRDPSSTKLENDSNFNQALINKFNTEIDKDNKVYKSNSASLYKKLSNLCTSLNLNKPAKYFMEKSQKIKLETMKTTLVSNEVQSSGAARASSGKDIQKGVRQ